MPKYVLVKIDEGAANILQEKGKGKIIINTEGFVDVVYRLPEGLNHGASQYVAAVLDAYARQESAEASDDSQR